MNFEPACHPATAWLRVFAATVLIVASPGSLRAVEIDETRPLFLNGKYTECIRACQEALKESDPAEEWRLLLAKSYLAVGRYTNAYEVINTNLSRFSGSIQMRLLGREVYLRNGQVEQAAELLSEINSLAGYRMWAYQDTANLVTLGRAAILLGADPRRVLEQFFDNAKKRDASHREPYLASGQLALDKNDYDLAAKTFTAGLKKFPEDADFYFGLAQAYAPSDRRQMLVSIDAALDHNPNHVGSFLLLVDHLVDGEEYKAAEDSLKKALAVNPHHPEAWAYQAVIAHLRNDAAAEGKARDAGLQFWKNNPEVDHLIGRKLSQKYRFAEGAAYQRRALQVDPDYQPARIQLCQDLLRLGEETDGWKLAAEIFAKDAYNVVAYNLTTLRDRVSTFRTLKDDGFVVRMDPREADVYGRRVLDLLRRARKVLCEKYGLSIEEPVVVEIFPQRKEFAVRTFGLPGA